MLTVKHRKAAHRAHGTPDGASAAPDSGMARGLPIQRVFQHCRWAKLGQVGLEAIWRVDPGSNDQCESSAVIPFCLAGSDSANAKPERKATSSYLSAPAPARTNTLPVPP